MTINTLYGYRKLPTGAAGVWTWRYRNALFLLFSAAISLPPHNCYAGGESKDYENNAYRLEIDNEIRLAAGRIDRNYFDFDAVLKNVGSRPKDLFSWVQSNTKILPYSGVLKGAWGVLMERGGNTLDRSLLLIELLERAGYEAELSRQRKE